LLTTKNRGNAKSVSVVTANYNNGQYLVEYFDSLMTSSVLADEIIIVDDGSIDDSKEIISRAARSNPLITPIYLHENVGFANALNIGVERATSEYILRLDPDDFIGPQRIEMQVDFLEKNLDIGIVGSNVIYCSGTDHKEVGASNFQSTSQWVHECYRTGDNGVMHGTVLGRSEHFKKNLYRQEWVPAEDYDLFTRMLVGGVRFANLMEQLTYVRIHEGSVTNNLRYDVFLKTFELRGERFGLFKPRILVIVAFLSRKHYRRYLSSNSRFFGLLHLILAGALSPFASLRRVRYLFFGRDR
jgi:glycosyltransferase involved in cell wall biosynthesis